MKTKTKIIRSILIFIELGAITGFILSAFVFLHYGALQDNTNPQLSGLDYTFNKDFFASSNVVLNNLLWFQRNILYPYTNDFGEYLYFEPIAILFIIVSIFASIVSQAHSGNSLFGNIVLIFGKIWWYTFATYYSFITIWWFYQLIIAGESFAVMKI